MAVQLLLGAWHVQTTPKTNQNVAIWNESFMVDVDKYGPMLAIAVVDVGVWGSVEVVWGGRDDV